MLLGKVWLIPVSKIKPNELNSVTNLDDLSTVKLYGRESMSKFGWTMVASYYNDDEYQDLVISAPVTGS